MAYKELQNQAKELGLPYNNVSAEELERSIAEAQAVQAQNDDSAKEEKPSKKSDYNTAIVYNGKHEVRRYEVAIHGEGFAELANEFASKSNYTVELEKTEVGLICPKCGYKHKGKIVKA